MIEYKPISANLGDPVALLGNANKQFSEIGDVFSKIRENRLKEDMFEEQKRQFGLELAETQAKREQQWREAILDSETKKEGFKTERDIAAAKIKSEWDKLLHEEERNKLFGKIMAETTDRISGNQQARLEQQIQKDFENTDTYKNYMAKATQLDKEASTLNDTIEKLTSEYNTIKKETEARKNIKKAEVKEENDIRKKFVSNVNLNLEDVADKDILTKSNIYNKYKDIINNNLTIDNASPELINDLKNEFGAGSIIRYPQRYINLLKELKNDEEIVKSYTEMLNKSKERKSNPNRIIYENEKLNIPDNTLANRMQELEKMINENNKRKNDITAQFQSSHQQLSKEWNKHRTKYDAQIRATNPGANAAEQFNIINQALSAHGFKVDPKDILQGGVLLNAAGKKTADDEAELLKLRAALGLGVGKGNGNRSGSVGSGKNASLDFVGKLEALARSTYGNELEGVTDKKQRKLINDMGAALKASFNQVGLRVSDNAIASALLDNMVNNSYAPLKFGGAFGFFNPTGLKLAFMPGGFGPDETSGRAITDIGIINDLLRTVRTPQDLQNVVKNSLLNQDIKNMYQRLWMLVNNGVGLDEDLQLLVPQESESEDEENKKDKK